MSRNPCYRCGFHDEDYGCTADPKQPWTVPEECYLYDEDEVNALQIGVSKNAYCAGGKRKGGDE